MTKEKELTRKKVVKVRNFMVTVRSTEPSEEAIQRFNSWINKKAYEKASNPFPHSGGRRFFLFIRYFI
ncbi:hypothetical protein ABLO26_22880 [Neobacillus sp. 179-J 1A1 HS]|uniref:hypothetical protein n=1 Tax=Neobacillus driksii TaxID=3035913 RepID=UPI0035BC41BC